MRLIVMTIISRALRRQAMAGLLFASALSFGLPCRAEQGDDAEYAALQATAKESFQGKAAPFVKTYCMDCHGSERKGRSQLSARAQEPRRRRLQQTVEAGARQREDPRHAAGRRGQAADG